MSTLTLDYFYNISNYQLLRLYQEQQKLCRDLDAPDYEYNTAICTDIEKEINRRLKAPLP